MLVEALKFLADLAIKGREPLRLNPADHRTARYAIGGEIAEFPIPPTPRKHTVSTLDDLIALANRFAGENDPVVWYDDGMVTVTIDDEGHRIESATFPLAYSDVFTRIVQLAASKEWLEQKPFIRLLRIELAGALEPVHLLESVRRVKFESGASATAEVRHARESLGREITSRVEASAEIPEEVTLMVPVYKSAGLTDRRPLRCAVEVDPGRGAFRLLPLPDEIERIQQAACADIGKLLVAGLNSDIPAYHGEP